MSDKDISQYSTSDFQNLKNPRDAIRSLSDVEYKNLIETRNTEIEELQEETFRESFALRLTDGSHAAGQSRKEFHGRDVWWNPRSANNYR